MGRMKDRVIEQMNTEITASRSDGAGSQFVVLDSQTRRVMTGALVMFPGQDEAALRALVAYASETCDASLLAWAADLSDQWSYTKEAQAMPSQEANNG